jgi:Ca-activated chloride channel family protein
MGRVFTRLLLVAAILAPAAAQAQGLLVVIDPDQSVRLPRPGIIWPPRHPPFVRPEVPPLPPTSYRVKELEINARLADQVAQVRMSQTFENTGSRPLEVAFLFPLPYDGAVDQMTLMIDGKEYPAKLLKADEARRLYEEIVRKNRDPALLEWMGTGLFKTSVFPVPPGQKRTVSLRYSQLCRKQEGLTDFLLPLSTARYTSDALEKIAIHVSIDSQEEIKNVYSPTHGVKVERPDDRHAAVSFTAQNDIPANDFRLFYDVGRGKVSARVLSYRPEKNEEGFFLLLASPQIKARDQKPPAKTVEFVIDRSGSMSGKKIEQVRKALKFVLENLREGDLFNIIAYDSEVEAFRPELEKFNDKTRKAALGFVEGIYAGGATNIDGAMKTALGQLKDSSRPNYIVFLTDGIPTTGVTDEAQILKNVKEENQVHARLFTFGVGFDVNSRLLDKMARENHGRSEYVRPNEDIEDRVSRLYQSIESPVMTGVQLDFLFDEVKTEEGSLIDRVYPKDSLDLFSGEQLVVVGRYKKPGTAKVVLKGSVDGSQQKLDFPAELTAHSGDESCGFIEKLWAVRRVGEIIDELDLKGKNDELIKELVDLAKKHGILTPYTSFFADDNTNLHDVTANEATAGRRLRALEQVDGQSGVAQREYKAALQRAEKATPGSGGAGLPAAEHSVAANGHGFANKPAESRSGLAPAAAPAADASGVDAFQFAAPEGAEELKKSGETIRNVGNRAFYRRNGQWIDSTLKEDQQQQAIRVKQFSRKYFDLAKRYGKRLTQYLVFDEPAIINVDSQAYLIEP